MLNKQQVSYLKKLAHDLKPIFQVGKNGISKEMVDNINIALENRELIKVSILQNCDMDKQEVAYDLSRLTKSEVVNVIGKTIILYKKSTKKQVINI